MNVHPDKNELRAFVDDKLADLNRARVVAGHLEECEFCREFVENCRLEIEALAEVANLPATDREQNLADSLFNGGLRGRVVELSVLSVAQPPVQLYLAADGSAGDRPSVASLATLYSAEPELVLRVMRDSGQGIEYLQLIGADQSLVAQALIQIADGGREYVTDATGKVVIKPGELPDLQNARWQIKLPDAKFDLKPLTYDPEQVESAQEFTLETEQHDRISVTFASKTEGKQILIRVLELDGNSDFGEVRVAISQPNLQEVKRVTANQAVPFGVIDPQHEINIRLFR